MIILFTFDLFIKIIEIPNNLVEDNELKEMLK